MRVTHLLSDLDFGGKERIALALARRGEQQGDIHDIVLFDRAPTEDGDCFPTEELPWTFLPRRGGLDLRFVKRLRAHLVCSETQVVHAHNDSALVYAVLAARRCRTRPGVVATFHTRPGHRTLAGRLMNRWSGKRAQAVYAVSPDLQDELVAQGWLHHCELLWNSVDETVYTPDGPRAGVRRQLGIPESSILITNVARFHPVKRQLDLLRAVRNLRQSEPRAHLLCVGVGPDRSHFDAEARGHDWCHVLNHSHDIPGLLRETDLFALPSDEECAPMALLEAMASAVPSVVGNAGSCAEMLGTGAPQPAGVTVAPGAVDEIEAALLSYCRDPRLRRLHGTAGRARVVSRFSESAQWVLYREAYRAAAP